MIRKIVLGLFILISLLKFFTFSYYLADDPTCGIVVAPHFSFSNHQLIDNPDTCVTLLKSENSFFGEGLYRFTFSWGWLGTAAAFFLLSLFPWLRKRRSSAAALSFYLYTGLVWSFLLRIVLFSGVNYTGFNYLNLQYLFLLYILFFIGRAVGKKRWDRGTLYRIAAGIISVLFLHALYHSNILLPYEVWLEKGMPV